MERLQRLSEATQARYRALSTRARLFLAAWLTIQLVLFGAFWWITPKRVFESLADWADGLRDARFGWVLLLGVLMLTSIPPMIGYTTAVTLCGFAFGLRAGFLLAMSGTLLGAMSAFFLARLLFSKYAARMISSQRGLVALGRAVRTHGTGLVCLIRLCPFPYSYSNFFFASVKEVSPGQFFTATCALGIKVLLGVYIGTRLYLFSDPAQRDEMDSTTKWLNSLSIVFSILLGTGVGAYVYRLTMGYVAEGEVALVEADLDADPDADADEVERFLQEEDALEAEEAGRARGRDFSDVTPLRKSRELKRAGDGNVDVEEDDEDAPGPEWDGPFSDFDENEMRNSMDVQVQK